MKHIILYISIWMIEHSFYLNLDKRIIYKRTYEDNYIEQYKFMDLFNVLDFSYILSSLIVLFYVGNWKEKEYIIIVLIYWVFLFLGYLFHILKLILMAIIIFQWLVYVQFLTFEKWYVVSDGTDKKHTHRTIENIWENNTLSWHLF